MLKHTIVIIIIRVVYATKMNTAKHIDVNKTKTAANVWQVLRYWLGHDAFHVEMMKRDGEALFRSDEKYVGTTSIAWIEAGEVWWRDSSVESGAASVRERTTYTTVGHRRQRQHDLLHSYTRSYCPHYKPSIEHLNPTHTIILWMYDFTN